MSEPVDPTIFNTPDRDVLDGSDINNIGRALLTLTKEVWVIKDRMMVLEAILEQKGISVEEEIDTFQPDAEFEKKLSEAGQALVKNVLNDLAAE